jgi:hypothetical protein
MYQKKTYNINISNYQMQTKKLQQHSKNKEKIINIKNNLFIKQPNKRKK